LTTLFDIFGFVSVLVHGLELVAQTLLLGSVAFVLFLASPLASDAQREPSSIADDSRRVVQAAALAMATTAMISAAMSAIVLAASLGVSWQQVAGARFIVVAAIKTLAAAAIFIVVTSQPLSPRSTRTAIGACALLLLGAAVATSHAAARISDSILLMVATGMHQLGAALWLGGLPCFWLALQHAGPSPSALQIGRRYSSLAMSGVALIVGGAAVFAVLYIGSVAGAYGTAYGAMAGTKSVLLGVLLLLGLANFRAVRGLARDMAATGRVRRFVEVEMGVAFAVLMAAASITSLPPTVDLVEDRLAWSDIVARMTPASPRWESPDHASLALPALQAQLDAEPRATQSASRLQAFVPGGGELPPRNAYDIAWSEYNHHWAGLVVAVIGLFALLRKSGRVPWAQHWPLLFLLLGLFVFLRADPEVWPMGELGLVESLKDPEVAQHKLFALLIVAFAWFEWRVTTGRSVSRRSARVFPLLVASAGTLLLAHSHALGNVKEELLIELTHLPIAVLGVTAGWARWLEVEAPLAEGRWAGWLWPVCFVLIGLLLIGYREA
jgi:copper resistance protein D